jgi:hypothetical protein
LPTESRGAKRKGDKKIKSEEKRGKRGDFESLLSF